MRDLGLAAAILTCPHTTAYRLHVTSWVPDPITCSKPHTFFPSGLGGC